MLEIELSDGSGKLDVDSNEAITLSQNFNLHTFAWIEGSKSWRFKLYQTPTNIRLTGWANTPMRKGYLKSIKVRVLLFGSLWKNGNLEFDTAENNYWNVYFTGEMGTLKKLIGEKKITDFDYPIVSGLVDMYAHAERVANDSDPTLDDYIFFEVAVINDNLEDKALPTKLVNSNVYNDSGIWKGFEGHNSNERLYYDYTSLTAYSKGTVILYTDGLYYRALDDTTTQENPDTAPSRWELIANIYEPLVPFPYVKNILNYIAAELGIAIGGKLWADPEFARLTFFNLKCLNALDDEELPTGDPGAEVNIKNHIPEVPINDVLKSIGQFFNQLIVYDEQTGTIEFIHRTDVVQQLNTIAFNKNVIAIREQYKERRTYSLRYSYKNEEVELATGGTTSTPNLSGIDGPEGSTIIEPLFTTLPTRVQGGFGFKGDVAPLTIADLNDDIAPIFIFYRGMRKTTRTVAGVGDVYDTAPCGSSNLAYEPPSGVAKDNYSLEWKGGKGLAAVWYNPYFATLNLAKVLKVNLLFTAQEFVNFNGLAKYAIWRYVCLFEEYEAVLKTNYLEVEAQVLSL